MAKALEFLDLDFHDPKKVFMAVSYGSVDFREIGKRKGVFSKTIKMPSTKRNDAFFGYSFEVSSEGNFDPKIKVPIVISEIEFTGTLQLKSIELINNQPVAYSVNIYSDIADWVSLVGEGSIRDLKHLGSHKLGKDVIKASNLTNGLTGEYCYPLISYGGFLQTLTATDSIDVSKFRPAFFILPLVRQIFLESGYTFIDKGLLDTPLKDAILPFTSKEVDLDPDLLKASVRRLSGQTNANGIAINLSVKNNSLTTTDSVYFTEITQDESGLFDLATNKYRAATTDVHNVSYSGDIRVDSGNMGSNATAQITLGVRVTGSTTAVTLMSSTFDISPNTSETFNVSFSSGLSLNKDDHIEVVCRTFLISPGLAKVEITRIYSLTGDFTITPQNAILAAGSLMEHSRLIQNIKKIDLLKEVIAMGNFRILTDNVSKTVEFIQADKFLTNELEDWTSKVDHSRPSKIEHIENLGAKQLEYLYNNDGDDLLIKDYSDRFDEVWGRKRVDMDSEYKKGKQTIYQSIFSTSIDVNASIDGLITPVMSKKEPVELGIVAASDVEYETNFENRILIYEGMRVGNFTLEGEYQTQYPYAYFTSNDFSLNWRTPSELVGGGAIGLVDRYWDLTLKRLNDSRLATYWMKLTELDIASLSFRKVKIIDGIHYYLNLVKDYKVNTNQPTQVELISR